MGILKEDIEDVEQTRGSDPLSTHQLLLQETHRSNTPAGVLPQHSEEANRDVAVSYAISRLWEMEPLS